MRVASIILPNADNNGESLAECHAAMQSTIVDMFGGFTSIASNGAWRDDSTGNLHFESRTQYLIAMEDSRVNRGKLESLAFFYGHMAQQFSVMVTHAAGDVVFVDIIKLATANAMMCAD